ncbi:MAG TPA: cation:proton antiporter [Pseudonocardiaceae bacterium]|nr:cation:proton antiporter [Pseudonocardiaceae bacterium]
MEIIPLDEHHLLMFWVQFVVLVLVARLLGAAMNRIGQPAVIGELAAGVVLGPTVFGALWPSGAAWLFPRDAEQSAMLLVAGWVGIVMLLILTGFETDLALIRQRGTAGVAVAGGSVLVPFVLGLGIGFVLPRVFIGEGKPAVVFALFIAAALSISSLPVIAKILSELGMTRRNFGQLTLAAGMANDVIGWLILGVIASMARSGSIHVGDLAVAVIGMVVFLGLAFTLGQRGVDRLLRRVRERHGGIVGAMAVTLMVAFGAGAITQALGVEAVLGAFVAGIVLGQSKFQDSRVRSNLQSVTLTVFAPLFFATAGLRVDLGLLRDPTVLLWSVIVIAVASIAKLLGAYAGGRLARLPHQEALALGVGLNARGALEIVIATVGLSLGVLNTRSYTVVVLMAIVTSMAAPPLLRMIAKRWQGTDEEQQRLQREQTLSTNLLVRANRILLPVQRGEGSVMAAKILDLAWPPGQEVTVLAVGAGGEAELSSIREVFQDRPVVEEWVESHDPVAAVIEHMALGYGIVGLGAAEGMHAGVLTSSLTDELLSGTTLPMLVVREGPQAKVQAVAGFSTVLVPVTGTVSNRAAQELAYSLAARAGAEVIILHVEPERRSNGRRTALRERSRGTVARQVLERARGLARRLGVSPQALVRTGYPTTEIIAAARETKADLVVLGSELRPMVPGEPFLGHLFEHVMDEVETNVAVLAAPPQWRAAHADGSN